MNNEDIINIVNKVFEEMEVDDTIKKIGGESSKIMCYLMTVLTVTV